MLSLSQGVRVFVRRLPTDMRLGYEGLMQTVRQVLQHDPLSGHLFVFLNRPRNRLKILFWEKGGFCLFCKRLEKGIFSLPAQNSSDAASQEMSRVELLMLLDGVVAEALQQKKRYVPLEKNVF